MHTHTQEWKTCTFLMTFASGIEDAVKIKL